MILRRSAVLLATAVLLTIAGCSFFGEQGPELTHLEPALSPDGRWLAYESAVDGKLELFARDIETGVAERLTENKADDFSPSWSPDGTSIVFASNRDNNVDIYILDIATRQTRRLTADAGTDMNPTWASDGRIYFNSDRTKAWQIYAVLPDGTSLAAITATATP
jgi:TolB protein